MMHSNEGYIKFDLNWEKKKFELSDKDLEYLNNYRQHLFNLGLIGFYPDKVGFGNISIRYNENEFIISGSATGGISNLTKEHYSLVKKYDIEKNYVHCVGEIKASAESLSHGAIYLANLSVNAVIHIHHMEMWKKYLNYLPTTNKNADYGTPEIALEISKHTNQDQGILIMGGHAEGIISYGKTLQEAYNTLLKYYNKL